MIIYGWLRHPTVLGTKRDICATCGVAGEHAIVRLARWATVFWTPIFPIWVSHKLVCGNCGAQTKLSWRQTRAALGSGKLPLPHRPAFDAYAEKIYDETYRRPAESELDDVTRNPKRDAWNVLLLAWPIIVGVLIAALVLWPRGIASPASANPSSSAPSVVVDHTCWIATDGTINGCRMVDGTLIGIDQGRETTCFFLEPMPTGDVHVRCKG